MATDYYELLEVPKSASDDEIKSAYRRLARELHPDANGGDPVAEARFKEVTVAYETLRDPERRRRYDMFGPDGARAGSGPNADMFGAGLGDIFEAFFRQSPFGSPTGGGQRRGEDIETFVELAFEEAVFGIERAVTVTGPSTCTTCEGTGARPGTSPVPCRECGGAGQVRRVRQSILGQVVTTTPCPRCRGIGEIVDSPCPDCRGEGRRTEHREVLLQVPPGVDDGTTLRVVGEGAAAVRSGPPGDLYVHLRVASDPRFERSGEDLLSAVHIPFTKASLGADIAVSTLDGDETVTIPAGTQSGTVIRLRGHGVPHVRGRGRGDLHLRIFVDTPTDLSKDQEQLLRELARQRGEDVAGEEHGLFSRLRSSLG